MPDDARPTALPRFRHPLAHDMQPAVRHGPQGAPGDYPFTLTALSGALGGEITGIDLSCLDGAGIEAFQGALADHLVLVVRDQNLAPGDQVTFARRLGTVRPWPYAAPMAGCPELTELISGPQDIHNFGGGWHTDSSTFARPPAYTVLYCVEGPQAGGDTSFANQYLAWETLPEDLRRALDGLKLVHATAKARVSPTMHAAPARALSPPHRCVCRHPTRDSPAFIPWGAPIPSRGARRFM
jgi:taurine dioxygenase